MSPSYTYISKILRVLCRILCFSLVTDSTCHDAAKQFARQGRHEHVVRVLSFRRNYQDMMPAESYDGVTEQNQATMDIYYKNSRRDGHLVGAKANNKVIKRRCMHAAQ